MENQKIEQNVQTARIAVYDDFLSAPRIIDIQPCDIKEYIEQISSKTYELASASGGVIPYTVIRQVTENFIHANFQEPTVSIFDKGCTIRFADQGPGIPDKAHAQLPGFSSATKEMKKYINGVGSGLPIVKEYLNFINGRLVIEDNLQAGTVITITTKESKEVEQKPVIYQEYSNKIENNQSNEVIQISSREKDILNLASQIPNIGPTEINKYLKISVSTAYRILENLEEKGLLEQSKNRKRTLTVLGHSYLKE